MTKIINSQKEIIFTMRRRGMSYRQIADFLMLSPNTVKSVCQRSNIQIQPQAKTDPALCRNCGEPLIQTPGAKRKLFCSDACRYAWWNAERSRQLYHLTCQRCGRKFISCGNKNRKFCGRECYLLSRYGEGLP